MLSLKIDFDTIDAYLIKRPWFDVLQNAMYNPNQILENNGILHKRLSCKVEKRNEEDNIVWKVWMYISEYTNYTRRRTLLYTLTLLSYCTTVLKYTINYQLHTFFFIIYVNIRIRVFDS